MWASNLANLELHTFLHKAGAIQRPTALAFDLDPGPAADILACCQVALQLKAVFDSLKLKSFPKTSGSKGMQIYVPLNTPVTYEIRGSIGADGVRYRHWHRRTDAPTPPTPPTHWDLGLGALP